MVFMMFLVGVFFVGFGINLMMYTELGLGPWDALYEALSITVGFSFSFWFFVVSLGMVVVVVLGERREKRRVGVHSIITVAILSLMIEIQQRWLFTNLAFVTGIEGIHYAILFNVGFILMGLGIGFYIVFRSDTAPREALVLLIRDKWGMNIGHVELMLNVLIVFGVYVMGGVVGIGTVVVALGIAYFISIGEKMVSLVSEKMGIVREEN